MDIALAIAIISLIVSFVVACASFAVAVAVIYREFIHNWFFKPRLEIEFSLEHPISRETIVEWPVGTSEFGRYKKAFWPRLRVTNKGRSAARRCEGILAEVRMPDGTLDKRYDPLTLRWAIAPIDRGLQPLDIARERVVDLNTFTTFVNERKAHFATHLHPRGIPLFLEPGDYWLCIVIYGDNFAPVKRGYAVHWDGKDYREVAMQPMNDKPSSMTAWPWKIIEEAEGKVD